MVGPASVERRRRARLPCRATAAAERLRLRHPILAPHDVDVLARFRQEVVAEGSA
jgi:hypothetical protein